MFILKIKMYFIYMNLYNLVLQQFNTSLENESYSKDIFSYLSEPKHEIITNFPLRLDDGTVNLMEEQKEVLILILINIQKLN